MPERTNGKKQTISVNQIVYKEMHRPQVTDNDSVFPIYTKVDGYRGNQYDTKAESSKKYKDRSQSHFNSPNNIRKLYFTHDKIYIDYYKSPGAQQLRLPAQTRASLSNDLIDVLTKIASYKMELSQYMMEKNINPHVKGPDEYILDGNVLGVINQVYTCNNIEEIYFDWTYMFSAGMRQVLYNQGFAGAIGEEALANILNTGRLPIKPMEKSDIWKGIFITNAFNRDEYAKALNDPDKFRHKYPRLKVIAMVSNLGDVIEQSVRSYSLVNELKSGGAEPWLMTNVNLLKNSNSQLIVTLLGDVPKLNKEFVAQESTYLFDKEFSKWIEAYKRNVEDYIRQTKYGTMNTQEKESEKDDILEMNDIEQRMAQIESEVGEENFKKILIGTTKVGKQFKTSELKSLFRSFTKPNRLKWSKMIGLSLE